MNWWIMLGLWDIQGGLAWYSKSIPSICKESDWRYNELVAVRGSETVTRRPSWHSILWLITSRKSQLWKVNSVFDWWYAVSGEGAYVQRFMCGLMSGTFALVGFGLEGGYDWMTSAQGGFSPGGIYQGIYYDTYEWGFMSDVRGLLGKEPWLQRIMSSGLCVGCFTLEGFCPKSFQPGGLCQGASGR